MPASERSPQRDIVRRQASEPLPLLSDNMLIAAVAAAFLLLHLLVAVTFLSRPTQAPNLEQDNSEQQTVSALYD